MSSGEAPVSRPSTPSHTMDCDTGLSTTTTGVPCAPRLERGDTERLGDGRTCRNRCRSEDAIPSAHLTVNRSPHADPHAMGQQGSGSPAAPVPARTSRALGWVDHTTCMAAISSVMRLEAERRPTNATMGSRCAGVSIEVTATPGETNDAVRCHSVRRGEAHRLVWCECDRSVSLRQCRRDRLDRPVQILFVQERRIQQLPR